MVSRDARVVSDRASERGAAIFIVVMALTMLTAIGVFAMKAGAMATSASGFDRQSTQNHYVGEYGLLGAVAELSTGRRNSYMDKMTKGLEQCSAVKGVTAAGAGSTVPCYRLYARDVSNAVNNSFSGRPLFEATTTAGVPGSLGPGSLDGDFVVELTDPGPVGMPVAGSDVGGTGPKFRYLQVTLTSTGQVRPTPPVGSALQANGCVADVVTSGGTVNAIGQLSGSETGRAFVVIGPMP